MTPRQLGVARVTRLEAAGINYEPPENQIVVWGIHGADNFVIGLMIGATLLVGEDPEHLRLRAMREVKNLPPDTTLRDTKGKPVGWFIYTGLPKDHCRAVAEREARL